MKIKSIILPIFAAVLLAVSPAIAVAGTAEGNYTVFGIGGYSCASYLEDYRKDNFRLKSLNWWIDGFMSAAGRYNDTEKPFGDVADHDGIYYLVREYCEENPLDALGTAAEIVADQLINRAGRREE